MKISLLNNTQLIDSHYKSISRHMQAQQQEIVEEQEQYYEYDQYSYPMDQYEERQSSQHESEDRIQIINPQEALNHMQMDFQEKQNNYYLTFGETLTLYHHSNFQEESFHNLFDSDNTGIKLVRPNPNYQVAQDEGNCVNCQPHMTIIRNHCGHGFCRECWVSSIHTQIGEKKVIPKCPQKDCKYYANYQLLQYLWLDNPHLHQQFSQNLCQQYCEKHPNIRKCPNASCQNIIDISRVKSSQFKCQCGLQICKLCGNEAHSPLRCNDMDIFTNIQQVLWEKHEKQNEQTFKICPYCQVNIVLNTPYLCKTCQNCGYQFCWSCLQKWQGHQYYSVCQFGEQFTSHETIGIQGNSVSYKDFRQTKTQIGFINQSILSILNYDLNELYEKFKEIGINQIDLQVLSQMRTFGVDAFEILKRCHIYIFLQLDGYLSLKELTSHITKVAKKIEYYLITIMPNQFKNLVCLFGGDKQARIKEIKGAFQEQRKLFKEMINQTNRLLKRIKDGEMQTAFKELKSHFNQIL